MQIESIFAGLAAPVLLGALLTKERYRAAFLLVACGYLACMLSAYFNTFFVGLYQTDFFVATAEIAPVVEEVMKLLPLLLYLAVFDPKPKDAFAAFIVVGVGFATFENACYIAANESASLSFMLMRGLGAGAMHVVCGALVGFGLAFAWKRPWLKVSGTCGLLCVAITYHAVFNTLANAEGAAQLIGFAFPLATALIAVVSLQLFKRFSPKER